MYVFHCEILVLGLVIGGFFLSTNKCLFFGLIIIIVKRQISVVGGVNELWS